MYGPLLRGPSGPPSSEFRGFRVLTYPAVFEEAWMQKKRGFRVRG